VMVVRPLALVFSQRPSLRFGFLDITKINHCCKQNRPFHHPLGLRRRQVLLGRKASEETGGIAKAVFGKWQSGTGSAVAKCAFTYKEGLRDWRRCKVGGGRQNLF
jgi:hypothetical protein